MTGNNISICEHVSVIHINNLLQALGNKNLRSSFGNWYKGEKMKRFLFSLFATGPEDSVNYFFAKLTNTVQEV